MSQKKIRLILTLLLCALCLPVFADSQIHEEHDVVYTVTTFDSEFPSEVNAALAQLRQSEGTPVRGAMVESVWTMPADVASSTDSKVMRYAQDRQAGQNYAIALCVLGRDGTDWVIGLRRDAQGVWRVTMASDRVVLPSREYTLTVEAEYDSWLHPLFTFTYPGENGGNDAYALTDFAQGYWRVAWYENRRADGTGLHIEAGDMSARYLAWDLPKTEDYTLRMRDYTYYTSPYLAYGAMLNASSIADFPTTEADAMKQAQASIDALPQDGILIGGFVNLRSKPSTSSRSLGQYYSGTIGTWLNDSSAENKGWYKAKVGGVEGYASGNYAVPVSTYLGYRKDLVAAYLPLGKLTRDCLLQATPQKSADGQTTLPQGQEVQVMGVVDETWLHVTLSPWGSVMSREAVSGYLPMDAVEVSGNN